jgi:hypothetical protein
MNDASLSTLSQFHNAVMHQPLCDKSTLLALWSLARTEPVELRHRHDAPILAAAARAGFEDSIDVLLELDDEFRGCDCLHEAIAACVCGGHVKCVVKLMLHGSSQVRERALYVAAMHADRLMVAEMLKVAPETDVLEAVRIAATFNHADVVDWLLCNNSSNTAKRGDLADAALWRACSSLSPAVVSLLLRTGRFDCAPSSEHFLACIGGGSARLRRCDREVLAGRICEILIETPCAAAALNKLGPLFLKKSAEMGHRRIFRLLLGHGARADDAALLECAVGLADTDVYYLTLLYEVGVRPAAQQQLSPSIAERLGATAKTALTANQHRRKVAAALSALTLGRIILQRGDRGALNVLTRWLDLDLLHALAAHELDERQLRTIMSVISNGVFFACKKEAITEILGWRALPSAN